MFPIQEPTTMDPTADLTIREYADLAHREQRGDVLSADDAEALRSARTASAPLKAVARRFSVMVRDFAETYEEEFAYVDSLPPWERRRYEHKTMPEIRRIMRRMACTSPRRPRTRSSHARRPGHRRAAARTRAGPDSDEPEPALSPNPPIR
jgi:hypothetical protein